MTEGVLQVSAGISQGHWQVPGQTESGSSLRPDQHQSWPRMLCIWDHRAAEHSAMQMAEAACISMNIAQEPKHQMLLYEQLAMLSLSAASFGWNRCCQLSMPAHCAVTLQDVSEQLQVTNPGGCQQMAAMHLRANC